jgi:hypothetical protein
MKISEQKYRELLGTHDWYYNFSDDYSVWAKGKSHAAKMWDLQPEVDPEFKIWNEYAPDDFKQKKI